VGTSGWIYQHWRGVFYPPGLSAVRWFEFYSRHLDTVEVNNTFYRLPSAEVFTAWGRQAPAGFVYAVKASRFLTHRKKLKDPAQPLETFQRRARHLGPRLGPVLYQLPPRWRCDVDRLRRFVALLPADLHHVFEFRDPSWYNPAVRDVLEGAGAGFCVHDLQGAPCPDWVTGPLAYLRFHGPTEAPYAGRYDPDQLRPWARWVQRVRESGRDVYVYFNNDGGGHAVANARELKVLLDLEAVPPAPCITPATKMLPQA